MKILAWITVGIAAFIGQAWFFYDTGRLYGQAAGIHWATRCAYHDEGCNDPPR